MSLTAKPAAPVGELSLQAQPFADELIDVAAVNAAVSDVLGARIDAVAAAAGRSHKAPLTKAYAVLGSAGGGKTHLFARLRHRSGLRPALVLLRPYFGVGITPRDVLAATIDQLCAGTQLVRIAEFWIAEPSAGSDADDKAALAAQHTRAIEQAVARIIAQLPHAEPAAHIITALLAVTGRVGPERWAELAWLSGREPRSTAERMLNEGDVLVVLRVLAHLAAPVAPLVIVFDQLENLAGDIDLRVLAYGNVIAELVDTVPGLTIVQLAVTSEWTHNIAPRLTLAQRSRVANDVMELHAPSRAQREALLQAWHVGLYQGDGPAFPAPLDEARLAMLLDAPSITPRKLLAELLAACTGVPSALRDDEVSGALPVVRTTLAGAVMPVPAAGGVPTVSSTLAGAVPPVSSGGSGVGNPVAPASTATLYGASSATFAAVAVPQAASVGAADSKSSLVVATVAAAVVPAAPPAPSLAHVWNYETQRVAIELKRRTIEQLPCADTQLAEAFCAALSFVDGVTTTTRQERSLVVIDVVAQGIDGEERCALVFITGLHHSTVVAGLNKSIELAKQGSVVVVREARFPLAETWALVQERSAEFDRMPHTGWLWLTDEDVQQSTALAQLFSQARGRRVRLSDGEAPLSLDEVRARLGELLTPSQWPMVVRIVGERESGTDTDT
ncbi:MAG TPA: hypothetical protein PLF40_04795, partial [Kofleriaceae bacterium]|nr:hypothetical protein [Kofleriaceae bacterium]